MTDTRHLSFDRIATTEEHDEPVVRAEFNDTGSYLNAVIEDRDTIRVTHVQSARDGDMSAMLDAMTRQLDTTDVRFMVPLGEQFGSDLADHLHGFERTTEQHDGPDGTVEVEVLRGDWIPEDHE